MDDTVTVYSIDFEWGITRELEFEDSRFTVAQTDKRNAMLEDLYSAGLVTGYRVTTLL